jgi:hypothetical protein
MSYSSILLLAFLIASSTVHSAEKDPKPLPDEGTRKFAETIANAISVVNKTDAKLLPETVRTFPVVVAWPTGLRLTGFLGPDEKSDAAATALKYWESEGQLSGVSVVFAVPFHHLEATWIPLMRELREHPEWDKRPMAPELIFVVVKPVVENAPVGRDVSAALEIIVDMDAANGPITKYFECCLAVGERGKMKLSTPQGLPEEAAGSAVVFRGQAPGPSFYRTIYASFRTEGIFPPLRPSEKTRAK